MFGMGVVSVAVAMSVTVFYKFKTDPCRFFKELCWLAARTASVSSMLFFRNLLDRKVVFLCEINF
jgi:hypothetical protein